MIPLLNGGERISAQLWNDLFGELDAKITATLAGRSPLVSGHEFPMGKSFYFNRGTSTFGAVAYDHKPFSDAAQDESLELELFDEEKRIAVFKQPIPITYRQRIGIATTSGQFFNESLEAHRRMFNPHPEVGGSAPQSFWLMEPGNFRPERISSYGIAELICEHPKDGTRLDIPANYNKYRFFRIHNLRSSALTVAFRNGDLISHSLSVPPFGVQCVRRDTATSGYVNGFNYFPSFQEGDPTVFQMPLYDSPSGSMGANPVVNPSIAYQIVAGLTQTPPGGGASVLIDPHELYDVGGLYSEIFPT